MSISKILENLSGEVNPSIISALESATDARAMVSSGEDTDGPADLHVLLLHNRRQIERLEELTSRFVLLKSRAKNQAVSAQAAYDDAYMKAATKPTKSLGDFSTAKEKDANYNLHTVAETITLRQAEHLLRDVESAWDYCRILLRGAEGAQRDIETRIRLITLTSALER